MKFSDYITESNTLSNYKKIKTDIDSLINDANDSLKTDKNDEYENALAAKDFWTEFKDHVDGLSLVIRTFNAIFLEFDYKDSFYKSKNLEDFEKATKAFEKAVRSASLKLK